MNKLSFEQVLLFTLAIIVAVALVATTVATRVPAWEIAYVAFVAVLISVYALYWLLRGEDGRK